MHHRYQAVLFDFDGVLVDSEPVHWACWRRVLGVFGIDLDWEHYQRSFIGVSDRKMIEELARLAPTPVSPDQIYLQYPEKNALFRKEMLASLPLSPGARELLGELRDYKLGVVSSSGRAEVEPILAAAKFLPFFGVTICGEDVTRHKPHPEPYQLAAARLGVTEALVVEDSEAGKASGRAAGFDVLRISSPEQMVEQVREWLVG
ncbi:MAG: HAD family phosphatase [Acidobacteria bacterium]|nr:HAD family phosphatase [Acidobacteriota bacterium]